MAHGHTALERIAHNIDQALTTLASEAVLELPAPIVTQNFAAALYQGSLTLQNFTAGEGPIGFGVYDAEMTTAEIAEALVAAPLNSRDTSPLEQSRRSVQYIGSLGTDLLTVDFNAGNRLAMYRENISWSFFL